MTDGQSPPGVDELLDQFIAAWHAGDAPSTADYVARAAATEQDELAEMLGAFLEIAPTVEPNEARAAELRSDPLVQRLTLLEDAWWDARAAEETDPVAAASAWGDRLRGLREAAGLSIAALAERFAEAFGVGGEDATRAPAVFSRLESGEVASTGVAARAARKLEELLSAPRGALAAGAAPALGGPLLRGALPEDADERERFAELLREVDDSLAVERGAADGTGETLEGLLGA